MSDQITHDCKVPESRHARLAALRSSSEQAPHGTRARYSGGKCRCFHCRLANARYESLRATKRRTGWSNRLVSADPVRSHLHRLSRQSVGYKSVAAAASLSASGLFQVLTGERTQVREDTQRKVLEVTADAAADRCLIPAGPTWKILDGLIADGYSKVQLAEWMGLKRAIQFGRDRITVRNAGRVRRMYEMLQQGRLRRSR